jgi:hypothetical protein
MSFRGRHTKDPITGSLLNTAEEEEGGRDRVMVGEIKEREGVVEGRADKDFVNKEASKRGPKATINVKGSKMAEGRGATGGDVFRKVKALGCPRKTKVVVGGK